MVLFDTPGWDLSGLGLVRDGDDPSKHSKNKKAKKRKHSSLTANTPAVSQANHRQDPVNNINSGARRKRESKPNKPKPKPRQQHSQQPSVSSDVTTPVQIGINTVDHSTQSAAPTIRLPASLAGSRFRLLNEALYTSSGVEAFKLLQASPSEFDMYHEGFRAQVNKWPLNPVTLMGNMIMDMVLPTDLKGEGKGKTGVGKVRFGSPPPAFGGTKSGGDGVSLAGGLLCVDLGCGEAGLAKRLSQESAGRVRVLSMDLVADSQGWITEANCSTHVPLPGSLEMEGNQIVDVVVCCLSLMGVDWVGMLIEARRILRLGGTLLIAEVTSRVDSFDKWTHLLTSQLGFTLHHPIDTQTSTHFFTAQFTKSSTATNSNSNSNSHSLAVSLSSASSRSTLISSSSSLLKPCVYKRR